MARDRLQGAEHLCACNKMHPPDSWEAPAVLPGALAPAQPPHLPLEGLPLLELSCLLPSLSLPTLNPPTPMAVEGTLENANLTQSDQFPALASL